VRLVEVIKPPSPTIARGWRISLPATIQGERQHAQGRSQGRHQDRVEPLKAAGADDRFEIDSFLVTATVLVHQLIVGRPRHSPGDWEHIGAGGDAS